MALQISQLSIKKINEKLNCIGAILVICMLNKNIPGVQKSEAKLEAPISSVLFMHLTKKSDI